MSAGKKDAGNTRGEGNEACPFYFLKQTFPRKGSLIIRSHGPERQLDRGHVIDIDNGSYSAVNRIRHWTFTIYLLISDFNPVFVDL